MPAILLTILAILVFMLLVYTCVEWHAARKGARNKEVIIQKNPEKLPTISVLLPVYNEKMVVERLLEAVSRLDYPSEALEILVLDDSTDECSDLIAGIVKRISGEGKNIRQLRRKSRIGFKAGNLAFGLDHAQGEFIAIFDADCRPYPQFLKQTIPFFSDQKLGFLQTGIKYENAEASFLTHFQALEFSHKDEVSSGLAKDNYMASLTGSACIWRRSCINAIGGISADTITEDVDMGYAAQLDKWRCLYLPDALASAELPETMASFRVQRQRWARGLVHNAIRHAGKIFSSQMSFLERIHAVSLVFSPLLLALFYIILLISPLIAIATPSLGISFHLLCILFLFSAIVWGWINTSSSASTNTEKGSGKKILDLVGYVLMFFPLSLYYLSAIIQLALGGGKAFHSTPKGYGRKRVPHPPINKILCLMEAFSFAYALMTIFLSIKYGNYWVLLYSSLCAAGFLLSLYFSLLDFLYDAPSPSHILITGASGSIGQALAREYARPNVSFTLVGRNLEKLQELAKDCALKGAKASIRQLDLSDTDAVRKFGEEIAIQNSPDLLIANAGLNTNIGPNAEGEKWEDSKKLIQVNIMSTFALIDAILPAMRKKKSGQIAIMSSLAAYYGLPHTPSYCATKAALRIWGASLRGWLQAEGIRVNVILPGYVESPMCEGMPGPKPFLWTAGRAAKTIRKGLERDKARISFPFPLNLGIWCLSLLPSCLAMPIARILGYGR